MRIEIHYCEEWDYKFDTISLAEELRDNFKVEAALVTGLFGIFDIIADGKVVFSKYETGRLPNYGEISRKLKALDNSS